jgi:hypothetical protein
MCKSWGKIRIWICIKMGSRTRNRIGFVSFCLDFTAIIQKCAKSKSTAPLKEQVKGKHNLLTYYDPFERYCPSTSVSIGRSSSVRRVRPRFHFGNENLNRSENFISLGSKKGMISLVLHRSETTKI